MASSLKCLTMKWTKGNPSYLLNMYLTVQSNKCRGMLQTHRERKGSGQRQHLHLHPGHSHPPPSVGYDCIAMVSPDSLITPLIILALLALILNFIFSLSFQRREKCMQLYATSREAKVEVCMVCSTIFPMKTGDIFQSLPGIPGT